MCTDADLRIVQVGTPPAVGPNGGVLAGQIQRTDGGVTGFMLPMLVEVSSTDVAVTVPATVSVLSDATFTVPVSVTGMSGVRSVDARFGSVGPGSVEGTLSLNADLDVATLLMATALPVSAMRDDLVTLSLSAGEPLQSVQVRLGAADGGVEAVTTTGSACTGDAGCWVLDMSGPTLNGLTGTFPVSVTATDMRGNTGTQVLTTSLQINRLRWVVQGLPGTDTARAAPAIGADGRIYVGSVLGTSLGSLRALRWEDGGIAVDATAPGAIESLAVASSATLANSAGQEELVFTSVNDSVGGAIGAVRSSDFVATAVVQGAVRSGVAPTGSAIALVKTSPTEIGAAGTFNRGVGASRFAVYNPLSSAEGRNAPDGGPTFNMSVDVNTGDVANNIVINPPNAYFVARPNSSSCTTQLIGAVSSSPTAGPTQTLLTGAACGFTAQSWTGGEVLVGGFIGTLSLYRVADMTFMTGDLGAAVPNGASAVRGPTEAYVGRGSDLIRYNPSTLMSQGTRLNPLNVNVDIRTSPVLGEPPLGSFESTGYAVDSTSGELWAFPLGAPMNSATNFGVVVSGGVRAHPTLDCNRRAGAATRRTGILYVVSLTGRVAAIIVDSPKLLSDAVWPKYQRTSGNAGNTDTSFGLNPGCP